MNKWKIKPLRDYNIQYEGAAELEISYEN